MWYNLQMNNEQLTKLPLPKQVLQVMDKLDEYGYSAFIRGECVRQLINGQTLFEYEVLTNAESARILAIFDSEVVTVLGIEISITTYVNLEYELAKRSAYSFNAIACRRKKGITSLADPYNGVAALEKGEIRRLVKTGDTMPTKQDLEDILLSKYVSEMLCEYGDSDFIQLIPELAMLDGEPEMKQVIFKNVGMSSPNLPLRYALLFCGLGKPDCRAADSNGEDVYYGQVERCRIYAVRIMARLGCDSQMIEDTEFIIENHQTLLHDTNFKKLKMI